MQGQIPAVNEDREHILKDVRCFALDMDGTIYLGEQWIEGAVEFLHRIEETGRSYVFVTNNSSKNAAVYVEKLHRMGLDRDFRPGDDLLSEEKLSGSQGLSVGESSFAGGI